MNLEAIKKLIQSRNQDDICIGYTLLLHCVKERNLNLFNQNSYHPLVIVPSMIKEILGGFGSRIITGWGYSRKEIFAVWPEEEGREYLRKCGYSGKYLV